LVSFCGIGDGIGKDLDEGTRLHLLKIQLGVLQRRPKMLQDPIYHEIAAKHLPAIVEKFRLSEGPQNAAMALINVITYTPYFVRFTRLPSQQPSERPTIAALEVHRWAEAVRQETISLEPDDVAEIGQFAATLLLLLGNEGVSEEDKETLIPKLRLWKRTYNGRLASSRASGVLRFWGAIGELLTMLIMMQSVKRMLEGPLTQCGGPQSGCGLSKTPSGGELLHCAKYCGAAHQKAAWGTHKKLCFPPAF
ncbi:hypothetical protein BDQ17DRAFT_1344500, partial [Cyathus striatus]